MLCQDVIIAMLTFALAFSILFTTLTRFGGATTFDPNKFSSNATLTPFVLYNFGFAEK